LTAALNSISFLSWKLSAVVMDCRGLYDGETVTAQIDDLEQGEKFLSPTYIDKKDGSTLLQLLVLNTHHT
jgi:hypothetical protein